MTAMMETYEIEAPAWDGGDIFAFGGDGALAEPLVSVVIPCYNNGRFLGEAIGSADPHGQRGDATLAIVREAGFASARTTAPPPVRGRPAAPAAPVRGGRGR